MRVLTASETHRLQSSQPAHGAMGGRRFDEARIDLSHVWRVLVRGRWIIVGATLLCLGLAAAYLSQAPQIYVAHAQVLIDTRQQRPIESEQVVANFDVTPSVVAGEVLSMRSNVLLGRVVDNLNLTEHPEFQVPDPAIRATLSTPEKRIHAVKVIQSKLDVRQSGVSHVMLISYGSEDPRTAARVANEIARQYIAEDIDLKRQATRQASTFLQDRIDELAQEVEQAEQAVVNYRRQMLQDIGSDDTALAQRLTELNTELVEVSEARAEAEIRYQTARNELDQGGPEALRGVVTSPTLDDMASTYASLAADQARLASTLGTDHPRYVSNQVQLEDLERSMDIEAQKQIATMRNEVQVAREREAALNRRIAEIQDQQNRLADASVRAGQLERSAAAARLVFEEYLTRFTETDAQSELQLPQARIIDRATVPVVASQPREKLVLALALAMGLSLGTSTVLLQAALVRKIGSVAELEQAAGVPVLTTLPLLGERPPTWPVGRERFEAETAARFNDRIKALRARLFQGNGAMASNVMMVTSAVPEEGKSTVSVALANSLRHVGHSVLLIDADLRRSGSCADFGLSKSDACLVDYLEGRDAPTERLLQYVETVDLPVIAPMRTTRASTDLLASGQFGRLMAFAADRFDFVVVDAPPAVSLADAQTIAAYCDSALMVVRSHYTRANLVSAAVADLSEAGTAVAGTVLSHVRRKESRADELYGYYYG